MGIQTINFFDIFFSAVKVKEEKGNLSMHLSMLKCED